MTTLKVRRLPALICAALLTTPTAALAQDTPKPPTISRTSVYLPGAANPASLRLKQNPQNALAPAIQAAQDGAPMWIVLGLGLTLGGGSFALYNEEHFENPDPALTTGSLVVCGAGLTILLGGALWNSLPKRGWVVPTKGGIAGGGTIKWGGKPAAGSKKK